MRKDNEHSSGSNYNRFSNNSSSNNNAESNRFQTGIGGKENEGSKIDFNLRSHKNFDSENSAKKLDKSNDKFSNQSNKFNADSKIRNQNKNLESDEQEFNKFSTTFTGEYFFLEYK